METGNLKVQSRSPQPHGETDDANLQSSMRDQISVSAFVAMVACNLMLLLMVAACSPPAHAQVVAPQASDVNARSFSVDVPIEPLTVTALNCCVSSGEFSVAGRRFGS